MLTFFRAAHFQVMTQMQISPSELLVVGTRGYLLALEKDTGMPIWKYQFQKSTWAKGFRHSHCLAQDLSDGLFDLELGAQKSIIQPNLRNKLGSPVNLSIRSLIPCAR